MFSLILLSLNLCLFLYILLYGFCFLTLPFIRPRKVREQTSTPINNDSVTVLIPSHNEGPSLIRTIDSVLQQDYGGHIRIAVLIQNTSDSSFEDIVSHFRFEWKTKNKSAVVYSGENREVVIHCSGVAPKKDKLNKILPEISSTYVAFLDADHRAGADWLSRSIARVATGEFSGMQSLRAPLSLKKMPQLWDSAQNHIGNELVNITLNRAVGTVFFTGTTCVFKAEDLRGRQFGDCVTEDTYLSYELLRDGKRIGYNSDSGSREEVAPDFHSYLARRRRWSCGHNKTFFDLIPGILRAPISLRTKISILVHGLFYTVPVAVCLLVNLYALHMFVQFTSRIQSLLVLIALIISFVVTLFMFGRHKSVLREVVVLALWVFPQITLLTPLVLLYTEHELYFFLTLFPYQRYLFWFHLGCLLAPIFLLFAGSLRIKVLSFNQLLLVLLTYPALFFLDLWACLLGFSDFIFGRPTWAKIRRTHEEDAINKGEAAKNSWVMVRWGGAAAALALLVVSFNDLTADSNCGNPEGMLFAPKLFIPESELEWAFKKSYSQKSDGTLAVEFHNVFSGLLSKTAEVAHYLDDKLVSRSKGNEKTAHNYIFDTTPGWKVHSYKAVLRNGDELCKRDDFFTSTVKELRDRKLYINGEEFLIKGIIPSFSPAQKEPGLEKGFNQIKALGANVVRYYHLVRGHIKNAIEAEQLLLIDQPDRSTWSDMDLNYAASRLGLAGRFETLEASTKDFPYILFHTLGNELEILNPAKEVPKLVALIEDLIADRNDDWFAYSSFFVFLKLPMKIYGLNMLDSGETYWREGLKTIAHLEKAFYASEFGGFVAHLEWTPPELRAYRIFDYWERIRAAGAFGAVFHQSHDNLAQPVIDGFNDPLSADRPDDLRGIWDVDNKAKLIERFVAQMFSDLDYAVLDDVVKPGQSEARVKLTNRRNYHLKNVRLFEGDELRAGPIDFSPEAAQEVSVALGSAREEERQFTARYTTHHGLTAVSTLRIRLPFASDTPSVLNEDLLNFSRGASGVEGQLLRSTQLKFVVPEGWKSVALNGEIHPVASRNMALQLRPTMEEVVNLEMSADAAAWSAVAPEEVGPGPRRVRFRLKRAYPKGASLLLAGLGTEEFWIRYGESEWTKTKAHKYRENIVSLDNFAYSTDDYFYLLLPRTKTIFIEKQDHPAGAEVGIVFEAPKVFSPTPFLLTRGD